MNVACRIHWSAVSLKTHSPCVDDEHSGVDRQWRASSVFFVNVGEPPGSQPEVGLLLETSNIGDHTSRFDRLRPTACFSKVVETYKQLQ